MCEKYSTDLVRFASRIESSKVLPYDNASIQQGSCCSLDGFLKQPNHLAQGFKIDIVEEKPASLWRFIISMIIAAFTPKPLGFTRFPRELRDLIYFSILFDERDDLPVCIRSAEPEATSKRIRFQNFISKPVQKRFRKKKDRKEPRKEPAYPMLLNLLLTSKTIKSEAEEVFFANVILNMPSHRIRDKELQSTFTSLSHAIPINAFQNLRYLNLSLAKTDIPTTPAEYGALWPDHPRLNESSLALNHTHLLHCTWKTNLEVVALLPRLRRLLMDLSHCDWITEIPNPAILAFSELDDEDEVAVDALYEFFRALMVRRKERGLGALEEFSVAASKGGNLWGYLTGREWAGYEGRELAESEARKLVFWGYREEGRAVREGAGRG